MDLGTEHAIGRRRSSHDPVEITLIVLGVAQHALVSRIEVVRATEIGLWSSGCAGSDEHVAQKRASSPLRAADKVGSRGCHGLRL